MLFLLIIFKLQDQRQFPLFVYEDQLKGNILLMVQSVLSKI
jgi:hypothetical protein